MIVRQHPFIAGNSSCPPHSFYPTQSGTFTAQPEPVSFGGVVAAVVTIGFAVWGLAELIGATTASPRACGACGRPGHDRRTCPYDGERVGFPRGIPKSGRCECCGAGHHKTQRHHTRGRSSVADFLDVCPRCHLECCHQGHFQNLAVKPRMCRMTGSLSSWRV